MKAHEALKRLTTWLPKKVIHDGGNGPYITRYFLAVLPNGGHVFLHEIHREDHDAAFHNHPWGDPAAIDGQAPDEETLCIILSGGYSEERIVPDGRTGAVHGATYVPGSVNVLRAETYHRITRMESMRPGMNREPTWTLIYTAPKKQTWGFLDKVTRVFEQWDDALKRRGLDKSTSSSGQEFEGDVVHVHSTTHFDWRDRIKILFGGITYMEEQVRLEVPCAGKTKVTKTRVLVGRPKWWPRGKPVIMGAEAR